MDNQKLRSLLPVTGMGAGVVLLLLLFGRGFWTEDPLVTNRAAEHRLATQLRGSDVVDARLWQDPIQALSDHFRNTSQGGSDDADQDGAPDDGAPFAPLAELVDESSNADQPEGPPLALVIAALLPGGGTSEESESRLRQRIALVSALALRGFVPEDEEHLSYLDPVRDRDILCTRLSVKKSSCSRAVAYEWFRRDPFARSPIHPAQGALLLWIVEDQVLDAGPRSTDALGNLSGLLARVVLGAGMTPERAAAIAPRLEYLVFGPATSRFLERVASAQQVRPAGASTSRPAGTPPELTLGPRGKALLDVADVYLDEPLTAEERRAAANVLAAMPDLESLPLADSASYSTTVKGFADALERTLAGLDISDSDPHWYRSISGRVTAAMIAAPTADLDTVADAADAYLDEGLAPQKRRQLLSDRDLSTAASSVSGLLPPAVQRAAAAALPLRHEDSDKDWRATVTGFWLAKLTDTEQTSEPVHWLASREEQSALRSAESESTPATALAASETLSHQIRQHLRVYSSRATAPLALVRAYADSERDEGRRFEASCSDATPTDPRRFVQTAVSDDALAKLLVDELGRRDVDVVRDPSQHVALIAEWDTLYGRSLPFLIEAEIQRRRGQDLRLCQSALYGMRLNQWGKPPDGVHRFSYLRGLDGVTPDQSDDHQSSERRSDDQFEARLLALERSEGPKQLDQIRRLGDAIAERQDELLDRGEGRFSAIGVLGSDVYDKELVLQVLRDKFPRAVFFTTDLDARYLEPRSYEYTHNLVVASSFGLALDPRLQCHIPPFRDTYSTSTFLAGLVALEETATSNWRIRDDDSKSGGDVTSTPVDRTGSWESAEPASSYGCNPRIEPSDLQAALRPRLFEIGRGRAVDITPDDSAVAAPTTTIVAASMALPSPSRFYPHRPDVGYRSRRVLAISMLLLVPGLWLIARPVATRAMRKLRRVVPGGSPPAAPAVARITMEPRWLVFETKVALSAAFVVAALWQLALSEDHSSLGEPLAWLSGVSIWPSEGLRFLGLSLALLLLMRAVRATRESDARLDRRFLPDAKLQRPRWRAVGAARQPEVERLRLLCRNAFSIEEWSARLRCRRRRLEPGGHASATSTWCRYRLLGLTPMRAIRVGVLTLALAAVVAFLIYELGIPNVPARGAVARWTHMVLMISSTVALVVLTLWVFDASRLCYRFVESLQMGHTRWPANRHNRGVAAEAGLPIDDLADLFDLEVIAERTETIGRLILYPFGVLFVLLVARSRLFDAWDWPWSVVLAVGLLLALALGSSVMLRRAALKARQAALKRLERLRLQRLNATPPGSAAPEHIALLIAEIEGIEQGAFGPWTSNPAIGALLLPFGGAGAGALLDFLSRLG